MQPAAGTLFYAGPGELHAAVLQQISIPGDMWIMYVY